MEPVRSGAVYQVLQSNNMGGGEPSTSVDNPEAQGGGGMHGVKQ